MTLAATEVQLASQVARTPIDIRRRYSENRHWRLYPKEWIYRNIPVAGRDVLDFGCGTGEITTQLAFLGARQVYALDATPGLVDLTRRRAELDGVSDRVQTVCGRVQDVEPRLVDVIVAFAVLHHCFPLETLLPALPRWLKPEGLFVTVEPVTYMASLERLRSRSGIPGDALDEGERKLTPADLRCVVSYLSEPRIVHFHVFGRFARLWPRSDRLLRRSDQLLLRVPTMWRLAGTALVVGRQRHRRGAAPVGR